MTHRIVALATALLAATGAEVTTGAEQGPLPIRDGRPVVATVNEGSVSLDELVMQLEPPIDRARLLSGRGTAGELATLDRLINVRLVALEGATMGLGDLGEIRKQVDVYSRQALRDVLLDDLVKDVKPDEAAVDAAYKDLVREWKTVSLLFTDEAAAARAQKALAGGEPWDTVSAAALADKSATNPDDNAYHRRKEFLPEIADAVSTLSVGQVSPVIRIQAGFVVLKVVDIRYADDPEAREEATEAVLRRQRQETVKARLQALRAENVVVHTDVLSSLDYEKGDLAALAKDTRVLAEIKGADPVTVGSLTESMQMQMFHGSEESAQGKRFNSRKTAALETTIDRRLLNAEAVRLGIDKSDAYIDKVYAFEESLVFEAFVNKVIAPDNKMREEEVKAYYDLHVSDYSTPGMIRARTLAFTSRAAAEDAIAKLRNGADFGWLASTADGQVAKDAAGLVVLDGRPVMQEALPAALRKAVADAKAGDVRLYESADSRFYVVSVQQVTAPEPRPFQEVHDEIAKKLYAQKLQKGIEDYARKLRPAAKVEIYLSKAE
jgi:parvulin-like peptidyl-prolyl isomerase